MLRCKKLAALSCALSMALALSACSGISTNWDYDTTQDFSMLQTYSWFTGKKTPTGDPRLDSELLDRRVRQSVETELAAKGFQKVDTAPDFIVDYHVFTDQKVQVDTYSESRSVRAWGGATQTTVRQYEQGTLVIDILARDAKRLLWQGVASATVRDNATPDERDARIREATKLLFARFPPDAQ